MSVGCWITDAAGYAPNRGYCSTNYAMTWLGRRVEIRPLSACQM